MKTPSIALSVLRTASLKSNLLNEENTKLLLLLLALYLLIISLAALIITIYDKYAAKKKPKSRVRESTLMAVGALGGAPVMLLTMLLIRHKTKHLKFMLGLPLVIILWAAAVIALILL